MVIDVFASKDVKVNTPTTLKGHSQLDAETVVRDRRNASKRIHVERIIGCAKTFNILKRQPYINGGNEHGWQDHGCASC